MKNLILLDSVYDPSVNIRFIRFKFLFDSKFFLGDSPDRKPPFLNFVDISLGGKVMPSQNVDVEREYKDHRL